MDTITTIAAILGLILISIAFLLIYGGIGNAILEERTDHGEQLWDTKERVIINSIYVALWPACILLAFLRWLFYYVPIEFIKWWKSLPDTDKHKNT